MTVGCKPVRVKTGDRFGRWVALSPWQGGANISCECDCGAQRGVRFTDLWNGRSRSCGCLRREALKRSCKTHGMWGTSTYNAWHSMKARCSNAKHPEYKNYGARGIKVCGAWKRFEAFYSDMGGCPKGMSLDRADNNGDYEPNNCRWADNEQQQNNKRTNRVIEFRGEKKTLTQWSKEVAIHYETLRHRLRKGLAPEEAFTSQVARRVK